MCGLACLYNFEEKNSSKDLYLVKKISDMQKHRGPDGDGTFIDNICVMAHNRLAILDLSENGNQPFFSDDNRYVMVYNGEIYNYIELRKDLNKKGWKFRTETDTEVLLKAYQQYGKNCLEKFNGMFSFIIYDKKLKTLFFARDRVGIKPLYFTKYENKIYFASEIKSLVKTIPYYNEANYQSIFDYLIFNRTDNGTETFFKNIKRVPSGTFGVIKNKELKMTKWWDSSNFISAKSSQNVESIHKNIEELLISSVKLRMRSDVTVGSCLSGGLDSSIITGILFEKNLVDDNFITFTSSFPNHNIDETVYVDDLNIKYPFKNYRTYPDAKSALDNFDSFTYFNDEPVFNPSFYSQYEVMRLASQHGVKVLLDGQGGDENFAGYQYFHGFHLNHLLERKRYFKFIIDSSRTLLNKQDKSWLQTLVFQNLPLSSKKFVLKNNFKHIDKDFFQNYIDSSVIFNEFFNASSLNESIVRHFQYKLQHLLRMEDRNSMAFSIEARVPYLDHRLIEYVLGISGSKKIEVGETKFLQKQSVGHFTSPLILNRKDKIGFGVPKKAWMKSKIWEDRSKDSLESLSNEFPGIFRKSIILNDPLEIWKINQLVAWKNLFFN